MAADFTFSWFEVLLFVLAGYLLIYGRFFRNRHINLPPGPKGWPVIGSLLQCGKQVPIKFHEWSQIYGDVFSVKLGTELVVVLGSHDAIKEAFVKKSESFAERPKRWSLSIATKNKGITTPWPEWKHTRKFIVRTFRELGAGKQVMEERVCAESDILVEYIVNNKPTDLTRVIYNAVSNVLCSELFGTRFRYDDDDFKILMKTMSLNVSAITDANILTFFPLLWYLPTSLKSKFLALQSALASYVENRIKECRQAMHGGDPDSVAEAFLQRDDWDDGKIGDLAQIGKGLLNAGADTTASVLMWAILYLAMNPEIQEKCYSEIAHVVGDEAHVRMRNRSKLPYIEATCLEIYRCSTVSPLGVPHGTTTDVDLYGYRIPEDTMVLGSLWSVHMDEKMWPSPREFKPERFLDANGEVVNRERVIPYGLGSRDCLGSELAKMEVLIFTTRLIQKFKFKLPSGCVAPPMHGKFEFVRHPHPYDVISEARH
ncbi:cytochrome P450 2U1-like [Saccoglossus kowalevskii]|uniref:Cytochrome P450 2U1-like n=1 Tax=Saccoglossus kowalevskii TaxID=10224 RepID=A0ABM0GY35_SACKO|nr:PREDICTED: cytochrome P450 2U1-like [Saccoglossus kowalevskii]